MKLGLLLNLIFAVWRLSSAEEYTNHWLASEDIANVEFCSHDGYLTGGTCKCDTDYNGDYCLTRKCRNFGFDGRLGTDGQGGVGVTDRCICPPGFLGRNCEPVKCVSGDQQIYSTYDNERSISLLASYNTQLQKMWETGSIGELVCNYTGFSRNVNYNFDNAGFAFDSNIIGEDCVQKLSEYLDPDTCEDENGNKEPCQLLNVDNLNKLVQNSPPNSIVFVVTNMIASFSDSSLVERIIGTAIAKRIQINVVIYNNTLPQLLASDPSLTYLSNIASATFGTFVLPSIDSNNEQFGIVQTLLNNWVNDIGVAAIFTNDVKNLPTDNSNDLYIAGQTLYSQDLIFNGDLPPVVAKTDFWKIYKLTAESFNPLLSVSGQVDGTPILVYSAGRIKAYSGFTSDIDTDSVIDVSYAVSVQKASYPLVFRLESAGTILTYSDIRQTLGTPKTISISKQSHRTGCQFNLQYSATCNSVGASVITIVTTDSRSVSFPVYCASADFAGSVFNFAEENYVDNHRFEKRQSLAEDVVCTSPVTNEVVGQRSFVVIAENSNDPIANKSSVDNVFRNKNSVFYQLGDYLNSGSYLRTPVYSNFLATLHFKDQILSPKSPDYSVFLTKIMSNTKTSQPHTGDIGNVNVTSLLVNTITNANAYSDILFVVNYNVSTDTADPTAIKTALAKQGSRLFVTFVQTYVSITDDVYEYMNDLSVASGGVAVRLNSYDDLHTFFIQYFPLLVANDIVAKSFSKNQKAGIALNNVYMTTDQHILLVTNQDLAGDGIVNATISIDNVAVVPLPQIGELQLFTLTPSSAGLYNIPIRFSSGIGRIANAVLLANSANNDIVSLSFLDKNNQNRKDVTFKDGKFTPYFYSSTPFSDGSMVTITYSDPDTPAKPVYSGPIVNSTNECGNFAYTTSIDWICSVSGGLYHVKVDRISENGNISRTFPVTCLGNSAGSCLNGGEAVAGGGCDCPVEWSGSYCETPQCQNGGSVTTANTCSCSSSFSGDFCEISLNNCTSSPSQPDYSSDLASLFIVADWQALKVNGLTAGIDITGVVINVVLYGDGNDPRLVQSTTNGQHIIDVLRAPTVSTTSPETTTVGTDTTTPPVVQNDMYKAINLALDNQFTSRSLVVVLTSNPDSNVDGDFLIRLAAKRAEVRVLSTSTAAWTSNFQTLALVGNGIPYVAGNGDFQKYLQNYIAPLFQSLQYSNGVPQRVFNVFQTGTFATSISVNIPKDSTFDNAKSLAFVHVYNGTCNKPLVANVGNTKIYAMPFNAVDGLSLTIEQTPPGFGGFYAVEVIGYLKTAYGFNNDPSGTGEALNSGVSYNQPNTMTIYTAPSATGLPLTNPANFPYIEMREITNGNVSDSTTALFTRKNGSNCFFTYFSALNVCSQSSTIGYQIQLTTRTQSMEIRQQQFVLTCHKTTYSSGTTTCGGTGSPKTVCDCDPGWTGIDCSKPLCQNGVRDYSVCRCPLQYYGRLCKDSYVEITTTTPSSVTSSSAPVQTTTQAPEVRVVAFVIDVIGSDDYAFNASTRAISEYVKAFNYVPYVMLVSNWNTPPPVHSTFLPYSNFDAITKALSLYFTIKKTQADSKNADLSTALSVIFNAYKNQTAQFKNTASMNIIYNTQIKLSADDDPTKVDGLDAFSKSAVVYSALAVSADPSIADSLNKFSTDVTAARDYYAGTKAMITSTSQNTQALNNMPPKPTYKCVHGLQSNIMVPIDRSLPSSDTVETNLNTFLSSFRDGFNFIENDNATVCTTGVLPNYYNERTAVTAFSFYDTTVKPVSFCPSQYTSNLNFPVTGTNPSAAYKLNTVTYMGRYINQNNCVCNRYDDENTFKYIIWLPRSKAPLNDGNGKDYWPLWKLNTANAYHFVVPFYDMTDKDNDLYYKILSEQDTVKQKGADWYLLQNAATNDVNEIINTLYEKLCEIANVDPTAVPPELESLDSSSRHKSIYSGFWN